MYSVIWYGEHQSGSHDNISTPERALDIAQTKAKNWPELVVFITEGDVILRDGYLQWCKSW